MKPDAARLRTMIRAVHAQPLAPADAEAIMEIAQLAVDADGVNEPGEIAMFFEIGRAVAELAGTADAPTPTFAADEDDRERVAELCKRISSREARELAYAIAYALTAGNLGEAPEEDDLVANLRSALAIDQLRVPVLDGLVERELFGRNGAA